MVALNPQAVLDQRGSNRHPVALIVGLVVCGLCTLIFLVGYGIAMGALSTTVSLFLALPTAMLLAGLILMVDRLEPEPTLNLVFSFAWGAGVALLGSFIVNSVSGAVLLAVLDPEVADYLTGTIVAPVVEESFKGALLLLFLFFRRNEIDGPTDGLVYAGLVALGFATVENVLYYLNAEASGSLLQVVILRGVISPLAHPLFTAAIGLGVAYAAKHHGARRFVAVVGGWCVAVFLHALWNGVTILGFLGMLISYPVLFGVFVALIVVIVKDRRRIVNLIRTHLPAYVPSGLVSPQDVQMLGTMAGRKQARNWARHHAGLNGVRAMGDYQLAATELALLHSHAANRAISPNEFHQRRASILVLMKTARDAFFRRMPQAKAPPPWVGQGPSGFVTPPAPGQTGPLPDISGQPTQVVRPVSGMRPQGPPPPVAQAPRPPQPQPPQPPPGASPHWPKNPPRR
ncbi:PrsW family intramembrane metalloprotease [Allosaccharopolyspora coralli]|uniref:PrsW family intramembrane metalloprotease n=1 Tax=Allosaccharopolyspora coralli TaxID=2665642 RepID=A0A5Q3QA92_9PSEU|nr:PrsW family glutamic-type intramembrane protease [Allosaccharopolyspora coralli]QGK71402.1 PrsW family intramembrane metalloprotease [Allosaccharopolyspora coralli]